MKKLLVAAFAAVLAVAFVVPASALEADFGGYWRTRAYTNQDFSGDDSESMDRTVVDTRTRLYFTAKINDNLKFVNKFEFDAVWGDNGYGDVGTDGKGLFEIKHSYADFNWMDVNFKIGMHGIVLQRGFLFDDDFAGATITYKTGALTLPFVWAKVEEGHVNFPGQKDANDYDEDLVVFYPAFAINDNMTVKALAAWQTQDETDVDVFFLGVDFDATFDALTIWFTGIYEFGDYNVEIAPGVFDNQDVDAYLLALGGSFDLGACDLHGQVFYASGDDDADEVEQFLVPAGQSYYWAEIMGYGIFDYDVSNGAPADKISNILAANIGVSCEPMDKLKLTADLWYAQLVEDDANGEDDLGVEIDLKATYELVEGLNLDVVAAYLFAGDATGDEDPYEIGTRLSLSF